MPTRPTHFALRKSSIRVGTLGTCPPKTPLVAPMLERTVRPREGCIYREISAHGMATGEASMKFFVRYFDEAVQAGLTPK